MDKLKMMSKDNVQANIEKIKALFPNAVTEVIRDGKTTLAVDFDVLKQEMSSFLIDDKEERYQFTWPDKKKSILLANSPISATLRPCKEESVDFDNTENLYIEGDNLDVLKLLQETYLGKIKMIYIDPPYNTGSDFVYEDDFSVDSLEYVSNSGQYDSQGNRLVQNMESNGRFHTDWLNMLYPRIKIAKDLLSDDGVIFISIDDNEVNNLKKICDEIFSENNFLANLIIVSAPAGTQSAVDFATQQSYCLVYRKSDKFSIAAIPLSEEELTSKYSYGVDDLGKYYIERLWKRGVGGRKEDVPSLHFPVYYDLETKNIYIDKEVDGLDKNRLIEIIPYQTAGVLGRWTWSREKMIKEKQYLTVVKVAGEWKLHKKVYMSDDKGRVPYTIIDSKLGRTELGSLEIKNIFDEKVFEYPKYSEFVKYFLKMQADKTALVLDFFSGSASTAHAVMQLNAEDGGNRKFIMVQLPEVCDEKSEAYKAGYKNICEIGKERIRRAGKKILEEQAHLLNAAKSGALQSGGAFAEFTSSESAKEIQQLVGQSLDIGFRVLKLDSSNMQDVYYTPTAMSQSLLDMTVDNIKPDRTPMDLLFQVMLDLGVELSAKIEERKVNGKTYFIVNGNDLIACFDDNIDNSVITEIAKMKPLYAIFKDRSFATDSVGINNEQLFKTYSPTTVIKVI